MTRLFTATVAAMLLTANACSSKAQPTEGAIPRETNGYPVDVLSVTDGDTFAIDSSRWSPFPNLTWKVRVRGIDTPEKHSKCQAERDVANRASVFTEKVIDHYHRKAWLQSVAFDKYGGRFDAVVVFADGQVLGDILVKAGLARPYLGGKRQPWCVFGQYRP